jgi:hypothetical protein
MKIGPMGDELFHLDIRNFAETHTKANVINRIYALF